MAANEVQGLLWVFNATTKKASGSVVEWSVEVPVDFDGDLNEPAVRVLVHYYVGLLEAGKATPATLRPGVRRSKGARLLKWYETPSRVSNWAKLGPFPVVVSCLERANGGVECGYQACKGRGSSCIRG